MTRKSIQLAVPLLTLFANLACSADSGSSTNSETMDETEEEGAMGATKDFDEDIDLCDQREFEHVAFDQVFWSAGFKMTFDGGKYLAATPDCPSTGLIIFSQFENRGEKPPSILGILLNAASVDYEGTIHSPMVPGERMGKGYLSFESRVGFDLAEATLLVGNSGEHMAQIPIGEESPDSLITLEPVTLDLLEDEFESNELHFKVTEASVRADTGRWHRNLEKEVVQIRLWIDVTAIGNQELASTRYFFLELPDGTSVGVSSSGDSELLDHDETKKDFYMSFDVDYPAEGKYVLSARSHDSSDVPGEFEFEVPALPYGP